MLLYRTFYVTISAIFYKNSFLGSNIHTDKEIMVSKVIKKARPIAEATLISIVLVTVALSVPAAIVYTTI